MSVKCDLRMLLVDDDRDTVDSAAVLLKALGYKVFSAYDAATALLIAAQHLPQVVILDAAMPKRDGYSLARELRELPVAKDAVIVCISGYGREEDRQRALAAGCDFHFVKPVENWEEMVRLLEQKAADRALVNKSIGTQEQCRMTKLE